jgi:hypothetical protein
MGLSNLNYSISEVWLRSGRDTWLFDDASNIVSNSSCVAHLSLFMAWLETESPGLYAGYEQVKEEL